MTKEYLDGVMAAQVIPDHLVRVQVLIGMNICAYPPTLRTSSKVMDENEGSTPFAHAFIVVVK